MADDRQPICVKGMDFRDLRLGNYYYVDKTGDLRQLLADDDTHLLLTRPRRFGKTLLQSTLHRFLELDYACPGVIPDERRQLFAGLKITEDECFCSKHLAQYPVIIISLKNIGGADFTEALYQLRALISDLYSAFLPLFDQAGTVTVSVSDYRLLSRYCNLEDLSDVQELKALIPNALVRLCTLLHRAYGRSVYVLIDEYDAPLNEAWARGYHEEMTALLRSMLHPLLKYDALPGPVQEGVSSGAIKRCILTGCLQVGKASIFTGANNVTVLGMEDSRCCTALGFTADEVRAMLEHYGLDGCAAAVEHWYDGYRFGREGSLSIYCPWSIASFCAAACADPGVTPRNYWVDSSANSILNLLMDELDDAGMQQLRTLLAGDSITIELQEAMAFEDLHSGSSDACLSMLYQTGYLTRCRSATDPARGLIAVRIPNEEVRECFSVQISRYLHCRRGHLPEAAQDSCTRLLTALGQGDASAAGTFLQELLSTHLPLTLTHGGHGGCRSEREWIYAMFVHFVLLTASAGRITALTMERSLGDGRADESFVFVRPTGTGCILEIKLAAGDDEQALAAAARCGLSQIRHKRYGEGLLHAEQLKRVLMFGIGCLRRKCMVVGEEIIRA